MYKHNYRGAFEKERIKKKKKSQSVCRSGRASFFSLLSSSSYGINPGDENVMERVHFAERF